MENMEITDLLNDLIRINGDRVEGYEKAAKELSGKNANLKNLFEKNARQSRQFYGQLSSLVVSEGGRPSSGSTAAGKVYRMWMDIKAGLISNENRSVLASCEFGEDAAQRAYEKALDATIELPLHVKDILSAEKQALQAAHDEIKDYRDKTEAMRERN